MVKSKKAQISIEALIITSVLIIGAVIFGSIYLSRLSKETKTAGDLSGLLDDFFIDGSGGGGDEPPIPHGYEIIVTLNPSGPSNINQNFQLNVAAKDGDSNPVPSKITKINIKLESGGSANNNCAYNNEAGNEFTPNLFFNGATNLTFTCSVADTYSIEITAENDSNSSQTASDSKEKTITPSPGIEQEEIFDIIIKSPENNSNFLYNQKLNLEAKTDFINKEHECVWYINTEIFKEIGTNNNCNIPNISIEDLLNKKILNLGENKIEVYATTEDGQEANDNVIIYILKDTPISLAAPNSVFVGEEFKLNVHGTDETTVKNSNTFKFENNKCFVTTGSTPICDLKMLGGVSIYSCDYSAKCNNPKYNQSGSHEPITLKVNILN